MPVYTFIKELDCQSSRKFSNSSIHNIYTRNKHNLHRPNASLSYFSKGTLYAGIRIFNVLPPSLTFLKNDKAKFKAALRRYLSTHSFYSVDKFFMCEDDVLCLFIKCL